jgi:hypothetical protein
MKFEEALEYCFSDRIVRHERWRMIAYLSGLHDRHSKGANFRLNFSDQKDTNLRLKQHTFYQFRVEDSSNNTIILDNIARGMAEVFSIPIIETMGFRVSKINLDDDCWELIDEA